MRNRTKVAIAAVAVVTLASATAFAASASYLVAALTGITACAITSFTVTALDRSTTITLNSHARKHVKPLHDRLTRLDSATARTNDIAGSVHRLRRESESIREALNGATQAISANVDHTSSAPTEGSGSLKSAIHYATHPARTSLTSGPLAAAGKEKANETRLLRAVSPGRATLGEAKADRVAYIGGPTPDDTSSVQWTPLRPSFPVEQLQVERPKLILIDGPSLNKGLWTTASDAVGSRMYLTLWEVLTHARGNHIPTVLIDQSARDSTFSEELRIMSDVVVSNGRYSVGHGAQNNLHFLNDVLASLSLTQ